MPFILTSAQSRSVSQLPCIITIQRPRIYLRGAHRFRNAHICIKLPIAYVSTLIIPANGQSKSRCGLHGAPPAAGGYPRPTALPRLPPAAKPELFPAARTSCPVLTDVLQYFPATLCSLPPLAALSTLPFLKCNLPAAKHQLSCPDCEKQHGQSEQG